MKWKIPENYEHRVIKKFLIIPRELNREVRWLESAKIKQQYCSYTGEWVDKNWTN